MASTLNASLRVILKSLPSGVIALINDKCSQ
jgi:hypothetical protein